MVYSLVDAVVWYNTPLLRQEGSEEVQLFQRTWEFECSNGLLLERPSLNNESVKECELLFGLSMKPDDAYVLLKGVCDFMMTWSYALIWFSWESIVMYLWIERREDNESKGMKLIYWHSCVAFTINFLVYPLSLFILMGGQIIAIATRHMNNDERSWWIYAAVTNLLLILYNVTIRGIYLRGAFDVSAGWLDASRRLQWWRLSICFV